MSDDERKYVREEPELFGRQDPYIEEEEVEGEEFLEEEEGEFLGEEEWEEEGDLVAEDDEYVEEENGFPGLEGEYVEEENGFPDLEGEYVEEEENGSTLNGNSSFEEDLTTVEEEGSSLDEASPPTVKKSPSVEEKRPTVGVTFSAIAKEYPAFKVDYVAIVEQDSTVKMDSAIMKDDPAIEVEYLALLRRVVVDTEKDHPFFKKRLAGTSKQDSPTEKECQTIEQEVTYREITSDEEESDPAEISCAGYGYYDKGCQTTSVADNRPLPIDREIQTTLRFETSFSTSSLNASMGDDSGNSLNECPSIEEEPPPEPVQIVQVRAQVMVRNDSTGGWVPQGRGGMSTVTITRTEVARRQGGVTKIGNKYVIKGTRLADEKESMTCIVVDEFEYNKVMPTFHHWKLGGKKYGLTFQTTSEAKMFDQNLRETVYKSMLENDPNAVPLKTQGDGDDDFLAFTKPAEPRPRTPSPEVVYELPECLLPYAEDEERIQFMQLTDLPEYFYKDYRARPPRSVLKLRRRPLHRTRKPLKLFGLIRRTTRLRCKYCHELYEEEENKKGQCRYAPDVVKKVIDELSCMRCAKFILNDCMFDPDEDYSHPCSCRDDGYCGLRWAGLCVLSFLMPCVLFYPPMRGCYDCGVHCGVCGGRHEEKIIRRVEHII